LVNTLQKWIDQNLGQIKLNKQLAGKDDLSPLILEITTDSDCVPENLKRVFISEEFSEK
jgi:hypothetical protein